MFKPPENALAFVVVGSTAHAARPSVALVAPAGVQTYTVGLEAAEHELLT